MTRLVHSVSSLVLLLGLSGPCPASTLDDAMAAYCRGHYATALRLFRPLAEWGNPTAEYYVCAIPRLGHAARDFGMDPLDLEIERAECKYSIPSAPARTCTDKKSLPERRDEYGNALPSRANPAQPDNSVEIELKKLDAKKPGRYVAMTRDGYHGG